ncbi:DUF2946 family protein [Halopseudomonas salegens]|uniref:DUF2946 domain-containing protein n=1 Tax=Halopseudomonas salegens TaxID=1434072 RepID=A0A1H2HV88_9GAMM|nr:DUF2946 family protein [Halopseudomonas salegens]SDU35791.1 Protein of unknown function [Halopseudomonas salegens]
MSASRNRRSWIALFLSWCLFLNVYACCLNQAEMVAPGPDSVAVAYCSLSERAAQTVALDGGESGAGSMVMLAPDCPLCSSGTSVALLATDWHLPPVPGLHPPVQPSSALPLISQPPHWPPASPRASPLTA